VQCKIFKVCQKSCTAAQERDTLCQLPDFLLVGMRQSIGKAQDVRGHAGGAYALTDLFLIFL